VRGEKTSSLSLFDFNSWLNLMRIPGKSKGCSSNVTEVPGMLQGVRSGMGVYIHFFFQMVGFFFVFFRACFYFSKYHIVLDLLNLDIIKLKLGLT
jgi:hypothetical protein